MKYSLNSFKIECECKENIYELHLWRRNTNDVVRNVGTELFLLLLMKIERGAICMPIVNLNFLELKFLYFD